MTESEATDLVAEALRVAVQKIVDAEPRLLGLKIRGVTIFGQPLEVNVELMFATEKDAC